MDDPNSGHGGDWFHASDIVDCSLISQAILAIGCSATGTVDGFVIGLFAPCPHLDRQRHQTSHHEAQTMKIPAILVLTAVLLPLMAAPGQATDVLTARNAWAQAAAGKLTIVDIRSPQEWRASGVAKGAWRITIHGERQMAGFLNKLLARTEGDRTRRLTLICASGGRSNHTLQFLRKKGFTNVTHIAEGMLGRSVFRGGGKGWIKHGLPTEQH